MFWLKSVKMVGQLEVTGNSLLDHIGRNFLIKASWPISPLWLWELENLLPDGEESFVLVF